MTTIHFNSWINSVATAITSVVFSDPTAAYGLRRTDTNSIVVAAGTAIASTGAGTYQYTFADPAQGLGYEYWIKIVDTDGLTDFFHLDTLVPTFINQELTIGASGYLLQGPELMMVHGSGAASLQNVNAMIVDTRQFAYDTTVTSFATSIRSVVWLNALLPCNEILGQAAIGTGIYATAVPSLIVGTYTAILQDGTDSNAIRLLTEQFYWDGQTVTPIEGILAGVYNAVTVPIPIGAGQFAKEITIRANNGDAVPQATVKVYRDPGYVSWVAGPMITDDQGKVTFMLNSGTYYAVAQRANANIVNPQQFSVA